MEVQVKELSDSKIALTITLSAQEFEEYEKRTVEFFGSSLKLKGFRKGKAPAEAVRKEMGTETLLTRSAERAIQETYSSVVSKKELEPISQPQVEILKLAPGNDFEFRAVFTALSKLEIPDYRKIAKGVKREEITVSQKEIQDTLEWLQRAKPELKEVQVSAQKGHFVEIEFSSPEIQGGRKHGDAFILGKGHVVPGFGEQLSGMRAGKEKDFLLTLPKDFSLKDIAGKKARFHVKMKKVCEMEKRQINDAFAQHVGDFKNLDELEQSIREGLEKEKSMADDRRREEEVLEKVVKKTHINVPALFMEREKEKRLDDLKKRDLKEMDMSFEEYLKKIGKSEAELEKAIEKEVHKGIERFLVLRELAKREKIEVSNGEVEEAVQEALSRYPDPQKAREVIDASELRRYTETRIKNQKTLKRLLSFN